MQYDPGCSRIILVCSLFDSSLLEPENKLNDEIIRFSFLNYLSRQFLLLLQFTDLSVVMSVVYTRDDDTVLEAMFIAKPLKHSLWLLLLKAPLVKLSTMIIRSTTNYTYPASFIWCASCWTKLLWWHLMREEIIQSDARLVGRCLVYRIGLRNRAWKGLSGKNGAKCCVVTLKWSSLLSLLCLHSSHMPLPLHPWLRPAQAQQEEEVVEVEVKEED